MWLFGNVIDDQRTASFLLETGKHVHISSMCRAMRRLQISRVKVSAVPTQRNPRSNLSASPVHTYRFSTGRLNETSCALLPFLLSS